MDYEVSDGGDWAAAIPWGDSGIFLLREKGREGGSAPVVKEKSSPESKEEKAVFCRNCTRQITYAKELFAIDGSHTHTFFNPAGIVFEIVCFAAAPGCSVEGEASSNFTWFPGYTWRVAFCGGCFTHLGWFFESGDSSFFGLILNKLAGDI